MEVAAEILPPPLNPTFPIHEQIARNLQFQIRTGALKVGARLPSESDLQRSYGVSRTPVRQALQALEAAGVILRSQGRGSFVTQQKIGGAVRNMISFGQELMNAGHVVAAKTLAINLVPGEASVSEMLRVPVDEPLIELRRLYLVDGEPMVVFQHHLRPVITLERLRALGDFWSLYKYLQAQGYEAVEAIETIGAALVDGEEAALLNVTPPTAGILAHQTWLTAGGIPMWHSRLLIRADRYEYHVHLRKVP